MNRRPTTIARLLRKAETLVAAKRTAIPALQVATSHIPSAGLGVITNKTLKPLTAVALFNGKVTTAAVIEAIKEDPMDDRAKKDMFIAISSAAGKYLLAPKDMKDRGAAWFSNHSPTAEPSCNCAILQIKSQQEGRYLTVLFTTKAVRKGREILWDYDPAKQIVFG